jgi:hypothetical protein
MDHLIEYLRHWAQRASRHLHLRQPEPEAGEDKRSYRLSGWPALPDPYRTAPVYRLMSVMTVRSVNRRWMRWQTRLGANELDALLLVLRQQQLLKTAALVPACSPRAPQSVVPFGRPAQLEPVHVHLV